MTNKSRSADPMTVLERRAYESTRGTAARDVAGRRTQTTIDAACPFCGVAMTLYVWSLCGGGKRCRCGAKLYSGGVAECLRPGAMINETPNSSARRREWEVYAPSGHRFTTDGMHALTVQGTRGEAENRARHAEIAPCPEGCICRTDGREGSTISDERMARISRSFWEHAREDDEREMAKLRRPLEDGDAGKGES